MTSKKLLLLPEPIFSPDPPNGNPRTHNFFYHINNSVFKCFTIFGFCFKLSTSLESIRLDNLHLASILLQHVLWLWLFSCIEIALSPCCQSLKPFAIVWVAKWYKVDSKVFLQLKNNITNVFQLYRCSCGVFC